MHNVSINLSNGSYLEPLPFGVEFDLISAQGTLHHCADPAGALKNLSHHLKDDGFITMHMYGLRLDQEKFDIKEMLSILQPDLSEHHERFVLYRALIKHQQHSNIIKKCLDISLLDIFRYVRMNLRNFKRKCLGVSWSLAWNTDYPKLNPPWIDHYCHPCERAYEVPEICSLVEESGLKIVSMLGQGKEQKSFIPPVWKLIYEKLSDNDKCRLMELLTPAQSFRLVLCK